ncbi:MAG: glycosyltransferase family 39 protein [Nitrospirales bacterium]|nr:glycosyltransferase family 39 protein [Nitrospirales bacterium]
MQLTRRQQIELVLVVAISAVATAVMVATGRFETVIENPVVLLYDREYAPATSGTDRIEGEWEIGPHGLVLPPGRSGSVTVHIPNVRAGQVFLILQSLGPVGSGYVVSVSLDGQTFHKAQKGTFSKNARIDLTPAVSPFQPAWIKVRVTAEAIGLPSGPEVLSRIRVVERPVPSSFANPAFASLIVFTPVLAYLTRARQRTTGEMLYSLGVLCGLVVLIETIARVGTADLQYGVSLDAFAQERNAYLVVPYALLLALWMWPVRKGEGAIFSKRVWEGFALAGILVWALVIRLEQFQSFAGAPLLPDAVLYRELALAMNSPYDTGMREPLWIWMIRGWFWLVGESEQALRVLTLVLSLGVLVAACKLFRDYTGRPFVGLLVALLLSLNPYLVRLSAGGLREEAYMLLILCFVYLVFVRTRERSLVAQAIGIALSGAALLLLRLNSYVFVVPLLLFWGWKRSTEHGRRSWIALALIGSFLAVAVAPHLVHNERLFGDPLFSLNNLATGTRNQEFIIVKGTGCPGCPTAEQVRQNLFHGPPVTTFEYLFRMHSLRELAGGLAEGYWNMYLWPSDLYRVLVGPQLPVLTYGFYILGLGLVLFSPHREVVLVMVLLSNMFPFFLAMKILDVRLVMHLVPFVAFLVAYGVWRTMEIVVRFVSALSATGALSRRMAGVLR